MAAINKETIDGPNTKEDIRGILDSIAIEQAAEGSKFKVSDMWTGGPSQHRRRMLIGISSQFFQQITGCNAVIYYSPILFLDALKTSRHFSQLIGGVDMIVYAVFALLSFWTVESVGRRKVFLIGTAGQMVSFKNVSWKNTADINRTGVDDHHFRLSHPWNCRAGQGSRFRSLPLHRLLRTIVPDCAMALCGELGLLF